MEKYPDISGIFIGIAIQLRSGHLSSSIWISIRSCRDFVYSVIQNGYAILHVAKYNKKQ